MIGAEVTKGERQLDNTPSCQRKWIQNESTVKLKVISHWLPWLQMEPVVCVW